MLLEEESVLVCASTPERQGSVHQCLHRSQKESHRCRFREFTLEVKGSFSRRFSKRWAGGFGLKYIRSDLASGIMVGRQPSFVGESVAFDLSTTFQSPNLTVGLALSNLGQKISYRTF